MEHILVGMSGGVDSSVAALILQRQGCAVTGVTLRLRGGRLAASTGAGVQRDIDDARRVCEALGIEHRVLDLTDAAAWWTSSRPNIWPAALPTPA